MPRALVLLLGWSMPGVVSAVQVWLLSYDHPDPPAAYLSQIPPWWLWAAATPALARLAERRPLLGPHRLRNLPWHIAACLAMAVSHALIILVLAHLVGTALANLPFLRAWWIVSLKIIFIVALAYAAVNAVTHVLRLRRTSADLEVRLARAQLDALRLQIRPHFLFNTLNTIAMQVRTGEHAAAVAMLSALGGLLRETIDDTAPEVALDRELGVARRWLDIERVRFGDRLRVTWDIGPDCERARVPAFLLQPLVENALRHGLGALPEGGELRIRARRVDARLSIEVVDDGKGLDGAPRLGVGLSNVRDRLAHMYPGAYQLAIAPRDDGRGVRAAVVIPFVEAARA
ncbi:MAG TPA: histidine kinase [Kofleriaceae bacterium]